MQNILQQLNSFGGTISQILTNISEQSKTQLGGWIIVGYGVVVIALIILHRILLKKQKKAIENLVLSYDTFRYQIAKAQYKNQSIQDSKGIQIIMESNRRNYPSNAKDIKKEILSIEQKLGQQIITTNERIILYEQTHRKNILTIFVQIIGTITTILTVGIYKVFR